MTTYFIHEDHLLPHGIRWAYIDVAVEYSAREFQETCYAQYTGPSGWKNARFNNALALAWDNMVMFGG